MCKGRAAIPPLPPSRPAGLPSLPSTRIFNGWEKAVPGCSAPRAGGDGGLGDPPVDHKVSGTTHRFNLIY